MSAPPTLRWSIYSRDKIRALDQLIAWLYPQTEVSGFKDLVREYMIKIVAMGQGIPMAIRARCLLTAALGLIDAQALVRSEMLPSEDEFVEKARATFQAMRAASSLVEPETSEEN